jgi:lambda repressor-like predicted transcriptional regulator
MKREELLRAEMERQGISVRRLAFDTGLASSTVQAVLRDTRNANLKSLETILDRRGMEMVFQHKGKD